MFVEGQECPACGNGILSKVHTSRDVEYKGARKTFHGYEFFCGGCGESFLTPSLEEEYDAELVVFFRDVDKLLHPKQIREIRKSFNLTQREFALKLGVGEKNFARYENGSVPQGRSMDILLRVFQEYPEAFHRVVEGKNEALETTVVDNKLFKFSRKQADVSWNSAHLTDDSTGVLDLYDNKIGMTVKIAGDFRCPSVTSTDSIDNDLDWKIASGGSF